MHVTSVPYVLDEETKEGNVYGYVFNTKTSQQLEIYLSLAMATDALLFISESYRTIAILTHLYIDEAFRHQGFGTSLLEDFIEKAKNKGAEAILLVADTAEDNAFNLVAWYEAYAFEIIHGKRASFPVMLKKLKIPYRGEKT